MKIIKVRNVHEALPRGVDLLTFEGIRRDSRNGPVYQYPTPVTTVYSEPLERVLFWPSRKANPFFHLYESLWMLAGRDDVEPLAEYVSRMKTFSDNGVTFNGAYGYRWREHFGRDQLKEIAEALKADPYDRRQILQIWDNERDLGTKSLDIPCNVVVSFQIGITGALNMVVFNRSNDMIWGAYGANAVHFSYLLEYMAARIGVKVGTYTQISTNFHAYEKVLQGISELAHQATPWLASRNPYNEDPERIKPFPLMSPDSRENPDLWDDQLYTFLSDPNAIGLRDPFFRRVAGPMHKAHLAYRDKENRDRFFHAKEIIQNDMAQCDWKVAATMWLDDVEARVIRKYRAEDDGVNYEN